MYQLPVTIFLVITIFAGGVFPASEATTEKKSTNAQLTQSSTNKNASTVTVAGNTTVPASLPGPNTTDDKHILSSSNTTNNETVKKDDSSSKKNETSVTSDDTTVITINKNITSDINIKKENDNGTVTGEQEDLISTHVTPHDDDEITVPPEETESAITTADQKSSTVADTSKKNTTDEKMTYAPKIFPEGEGIMTIDTADPATAERLNRTIYVVDNDTKKAESSYAVHAPDSETNSRSVKSTVKNDTKEGMPAGVIALVATSVCALTFIMMYLSTIVWRRYKEHRYGHRELLVNDLEFDTNDLRHFEL